MKFKTQELYRKTLIKFKYYPSAQNTLNCQMLMFNSLIVFHWPLGLLSKQNTCNALLNIRTKALANLDSRDNSPVHKKVVNSGTLPVT